MSPNSDVLYAGCLEPNYTPCKHLEWHDAAIYQIFCPVVAQMGIVFVCYFVLWPLHVRRLNSFDETYLTFVSKYLGSEAIYPEKVLWVNILHALQILFSINTVVFYVVSSYTHKAYSRFYVDRYFYVLYYIVMAIRAQFKVSSLWNMRALVDVLTVTPQVVADFGFYNNKHVWMTFDYMRILSVACAFEVLAFNGVFNRIPAFQRQVLQSTLYLAAMIVTFAGTVLYLELYGPITDLTDTFIKTDMGEISWAQMVYWTFVTITTVGYGDLTPKELLSRLFTVVFIVMGGLFFSMQAGNIIDTIESEAKGKGEYIRQRYGPRHIVIIGGGVQRFSSTMGAVLAELVYDGPGRHPTDVVCMANCEAPEQLREVISERWTDGKIYYFIGSSTSQMDLQRIKFYEAGMVFVIADLDSSESIRGDEENLLRVLSCNRIRRADCRLNVMTTRMESRIKAICVGIPEEDCFAVNELKANLFAQSCRCPGLSTMVSNFMLVDRFQENSGDPDWMKEYIRGTGMEVYGFCLAQEYWDRPFSEVVAEVYSPSGCVLLLAAQLKGIIMTNPFGHLIEPHQVVYGLAPSPEELKHFQFDSKEETVNWQDRLKQERAGAQRVSKSPIEAVHAENERLSMWEPEPLRDSQVQRPTSCGLPTDPHEVLRTRATACWDSQSKREMASVEAFLETVEQHASLDSRINDEQREAKEVAARGGHVLLGLLGEGCDMWVQVEAFLHPLREKTLPEILPVVVLSSTPPPKSFLKYQKVAFLIGNPTYINDLMKAGIANARAVVFMACQNQDASVVMDASSIGASMALEDIIEGEKSTNHRRCQPLIEIAHFDSLKLFRPLHKGSSENQQTWEPHRTEHKVRCWMDKTDSTLLGSHTARLFVDGPESTADSRDDKAVASHPRFAAGEVFIPSQLGSLFAMEYFTPGIIEFVNALLVPSRHGQDCMLWQAAVPPAFQGKTYEELLLHCVQESASSLITGDATSNPASSKSLLGMVLPLGLYRPAGLNESWLPYVYTNPARETILAEGDAVFVLASAAWGKELHQQGVRQTEPLLKTMRSNPTHALFSPC